MTLNPNKEFSALADAEFGLDQILSNFKTSPNRFFAKSPNQNLILARQFFTKSF